MLCKFIYHYYCYLAPSVGGDLNTGCDRPGVVMAVIGKLGSQPWWLHVRLVGSPIPILYLREVSDSV